MTRVAIVSDSSADLAPSVAAESGVTVVPVAIRLAAGAIRGRAGRPWEEGEPRDAGAFGDQAQPEMIAVFADAFAELAHTHDAVVAVLLSSRLGGSVAAALQARERVSDIVPVEIVDSRSVSLGLGFQALRAAELTRQGKTAAEIAAELRAALDRYHVVFSVESVEHLRQSGQIGRSAAMIAEALQLKPLLRIDEGQIVPYERVRTRTRAIAELADFVCELPAVERCAVLYATNRQDANRLVRVIAADTGLPPARLTVNHIGDAVAAQVGPGALGVAVVENDAR
ncbi:MAG: DegV family protein [Thermomicrobiales bacterium]